MTMITIHNKSLLTFNTKVGTIKAGGFIEIEKEMAEELLISYPNHLQKAASSKKKDEEINKLKEELEKAKKGKKIEAEKNSDSK